MSSRFATILALILLLGAAGLAITAWQLSQSPAPVAVVEPEPLPEIDEIAEEPAGFPVVFASEQIPPDSVITNDQLDTFLLPVQPPETFAEIEDLVGKRTWRSVAAGEMIRPGHLRVGSRLATTIHPHERAVAISVDEVIGGGGFLSPGDRVDVLLYLREAARDGYPSAQVVLQDVRLLTFAERIQPPPDTPRHEDDDDRTEFRGVTAVLAVSEPEVTRLMLASSAGTLRLALRSAFITGQEDEDPDSHKVLRTAGRDEDEAEAGDGTAEREDFARLVTLDELLPEPPEPPAREVQAASPPSPPPPRPKVRIHRGASTEEIMLEQ